MAKRKSGGNGLNMIARLSVEEAVKNAKLLKKELKDLGVGLPKASFDTNGLSAYKQAQLAMQEALKNARLETERLKQEQARLRAELEAGRVAQQKIATETERYKQKEQELRNQLAQGKITQQEYNNEIAKAKLAQQAQISELNKAKIAAANARAALAALNLQQKQLKIATEEARKAQKAANGSYDEANARLKQLGRQIKSVEGGFKSTSALQKARIAEYKRLNEELKKFDAMMGNHQRNVGNYSGALKGAANDLAGLATQYLSAANALQFVLTKTLEFERVRAPLIAILGSEGAATAKLDELEKFADRYGLVLSDLATTYKSFTAAARASNFDLNESERIFQAVAKSGSVLKLSGDQLQGALLAIQQMISKGNVQAEELRGQLSERLPGAFSLAAQAMGVTEKELNKLLQTGQVSAQDMLPKLARQLEKKYGEKASEGISGLNAELARMNTELEKAADQGGFLSEKLFQPIVRGVRMVFAELNQYGRAGSFGELLGDLFTWTGEQKRNRRAVYDLRDTYKNTRSQADAFAKLDYSKSGLAELRNQYTQVDQALKSAVKNHDAFKAAIEKGTAAETADRNLKTFNKVSIDLQRERARAGAALVAQRAKEANKLKEISDDELNSVAAIRKRIAELLKMPGSATPGSEIDQRIDRLKERLKALNDTAGAGMASQISLQKRVDAALAEARRKQKTSDEEEIQAVRDKYAALIKEVERFNANPKNKAKVGRAGELRSEMNDQIGAITYRQNTKKLEEQLDKEQELYEEFEDYKTGYGGKAATARYEKELQTGKTYLQRLKEERAKIEDDKSGKQAGPRSEALKMLDERIKEEQVAEDKKYNALLSQFMGYADKRKVMVENYEAEYARLSRNPAAQAERKRQHEKELHDLDVANMQKLDSYKQLFDGVEDMSKQSALKLVADTQQAFENSVKAGKIIDPAEIDRIRKYLASVAETIKKGSGHELIEMAATMDRIISSIGDMDEGFMKLASTLSNVVGQVGNIKKGLKDYKDADDGFGKATAGLGIIGAGVSIFKSIFNLFDQSEQRARIREEKAQYSRDIQNKQTEALNKALERQIALLDEVYGTERIDKYNQAILKARENEEKYTKQLAGRYMLTGDSQVDKSIERLNNGQGNIVDKTLFELIGGSLNKIDVVGKNLEELRRLFDDPHLDDTTRTILDNLIKSKEAAIQLENSLRAERIGAGLSNIVDDFFSDMQDGMGGVEKSLQTAIRRGFLQGLKGEITQKFMQDFYSQLDEALKDGIISAEEDRKLREKYEEAERYGKQKLEYIDKVAPDPGDGTNGPAARAIKTISSEQANALEGIQRGSNELLRSGNSVRLKIDSNVAAMAASISKQLDIMTEGLKYQERAEAQRDKMINNLASAVTELKAINTNTKSTGIGSRSLPV